jgi:hypothetical protein
VVARELTKQFEEVRRGTVVDLAAYYQSSSPRGEVVIVLEGMTPQPLDEDQLRSPRAISPVTPGSVRVTSPQHSCVMTVCPAILPIDSLTKHENRSSFHDGATGAGGCWRGSRRAASSLSRVFNTKAVTGMESLEPANLIQAVNEWTSLKVEKTEGRVTLMDERLSDYAFLHVTGHGDIKLSDAEVDRLRQYLLRGGFFT